MKARLITAIMLLVFAGGAALAQSYQIRVTWPVRLRASYSLDSPVVATALAGDVLQVAGRHNRWLKIERNGETAWLADWVDYTRLDQEAPSAAPAAESTAPISQQPSNIDNCCFVDRQCHTDGEWTDGYWAYQRNECPTPSQLGTSSASGAGHAIRIEGSQQFIGFISEALEYLRQRSIDWYDYIISPTVRIFEDERQHTAVALVHERTIAVAPYGRRITRFIHEENVIMMASLLVHEACHIHRYHQGFEYSGYTKVNEEIFCIEQEKAMLRATVAPHWQHLHGSIGVMHCEGDLTRHPRCRGFDVCEWTADRSRIISCPAIGLTRPSN